MDRLLRWTSHRTRAVSPATLPPLTRQRPGSAFESRHDGPRLSVRELLLLLKPATQAPVVTVLEWTIKGVRVVTDVTRDETCNVSIRPGEDPNRDLTPSAARSSADAVRACVLVATTMATGAVLGCTNHPADRPRIAPIEGTSAGDAFAPGRSLQSPAFPHQVTRWLYAAHQVHSPERKSVGIAIVRHPREERGARGWRAAQPRRKVSRCPPARGEEEGDRVMRSGASRDIDGRPSMSRASSSVATTRSGTRRPCGDEQGLLVAAAR